MTGRPRTRAPRRARVLTAAAGAGRAKVLKVTRTGPMRKTRVKGEPHEQDGTGDPQLKQQYVIGELAEELGITTRTIRFYEAKGLISPQRMGTARIYSRRDRARLQLILRGKNLGFTLEDIGHYLALYDTDPSQLQQTQMLLQRIEATIDELQQKRADLDRTLRELRDIKAQCQEHLKRQPGDKGGK